MDQVTQQNAALVEQASASALSLKEQAAQLETTVSVFRVRAAGDHGVGPA
jgi:methyl-accepting chemotaxis protein